MDKPNHIPPGNAAPRRIEQPQPHNWTVPALIALLIVALLMLGLSFDVQATVDAINKDLQ